MIFLKQDMGPDGFCFARGDTLAEAERALRGVMEAVRDRNARAAGPGKYDKDYVLGKVYPPYEIVKEAEGER